MGRPPTRSIGLGISAVRPPMRVPRPAASMTAFIHLSVHDLLANAGQPFWRATRRREHRTTGFRSALRLSSAPRPAPPDPPFTARSVAPPPQTTLAGPPP